MSEKVSSKSVHVSDGEIFYREAQCSGNNPSATILLLHGMRFSSATWLDLKTLEKLAEWNYRAVALDLPGYGDSKGTSLKGTHSNFIQEICHKLSIEKPVIISPSMSGQFSLPYLFEHGSSMTGYIPIAPLDTQCFTQKQYQNVTVPTLIVYGENDTGLGKTSFENLTNIPNKTVAEFKGAGHACYLDKPDEWHKTILEFLTKISAK